MGTKYIVGKIYGGGNKKNMVVGTKPMVMGTKT
jgi:hypothetical protein